jgi:hypothetical protein
VAAAVAAATLPLVSCDNGRSADLGQDTPETAATDRGALARQALSRLEGVLRSGDAGAAVTLAAPGDRSARQELGRMAENAARLRLSGLDLRYLTDSATTLTQTQRERWGDEAWVADVEVAWRYGGVDKAGSVLTVPVAMTYTSGRPRLLSADLPQAERLPLWLEDEVRVARGRSSVAVTTPNHAPQEFLGYARRAGRTVRASLPSWAGVLCVEVPRNQASFRDVAGVPQRQAAAIAAVTTTPDGTTTEGAPQHVFVNPRLFRPLGAEGRQIVLSHEAAHVALGAALLDVPMWLSEGIADYVALKQSTTSVDALAAQILRQVREDGAPTALPGGAEFDGSDDRIGAWYEAAWLAVRLIADSYGEDALWRFYRQSVRDEGSAAAFREVLGVSQSEFVRAWRSHLVALAG